VPDPNNDGACGDVTLAAAAAPLAPLAGALAYADDGARKRPVGGDGNVWITNARYDANA